MSSLRAREQRAPRSVTGESDPHQLPPGFASLRPEEPYTTSVRTVLWEPGRVTVPPTRHEGGAEPQKRPLVWSGAL
jgi:hypothetical protein